MKRAARLIEEHLPLELTSGRAERVSKVSRMSGRGGGDWLATLLAAEKSCLQEDKLRKVHYSLDARRELLEEYNTDTGVLVRRAWRRPAQLGGEAPWEVEVGDALPEPSALDTLGIAESNDQPVVTRRNTRINLEWRIRNLPYPIETYSISANPDETCIVVRTTNKKYYKKLLVPELQRLNLPVDQANIQSSHKFNTLIILYKKPKELLEMEKTLYEELKKVTPKANTDIPGDCKPS